MLAGLARAIPQYFQTMCPNLDPAAPLRLVYRYYIQGFEKGTRLFSAHLFCLAHSGFARR